MSFMNLRRMLHPGSVAIIGASERAGSVGQRVLQNILEGGFPGEVFAVNRNYKTCQGVACFDSIELATQSSSAGRIDLVVICTPAQTVADLLKRCGTCRARGVLILAAGYRESGEDGKQREQELQAIVRQFPKMRVIGPNSLGIINAQARLNASFAPACPPPGKIALLTQSGALATSMLDWAQDQNIGFSHFISFGNLIDVSIANLLDVLSDDSHCDSIVMYLESVGRARDFMSAARAYTREKPLIVFKPGRFERTAEASAMHTGAMMSVDAVYDAALARAGIVRVDRYDDLIDCAELLTRPTSSQAESLVILSNSGGAGLMAADACLQRAKLATLSPETITKVSADVLPGCRCRNPIDLLGEATPEHYRQTLQHVLADDAVDAALVLLTPQVLTQATEIAEAVISVAQQARKPVLSAWMGGQTVQAGIDRFNAAGLPVYRSPEQAIRAFSYLVQYHRNRESWYETPRSVPVRFVRDRQSLRKNLSDLMLSDSEILSESSSKALLEAYGIPTARPVVTRDADEAVKHANRIGFPVVLKIHAPQVIHKTDVDGVLLGVHDESSVRAGYDELVRRCRSRRPDAEVRGVSVQPMLVNPHGRELMIGARRDSVFGTVMLLGAGGVYAETLHDMALELPPLSERLAHRMLESLRCWPTLGEYRGKPAVDLEKVVDVLLRVSYLLADHPEIVELDINPLLATPRGATVLDAGILLDGRSKSTAKSAYPHLAICPYPDHLIKSATLPTGQQVVLRPIRAEDEPAWQAMLQSCSEQTIRYRFRYLFQQVTHDMATRFCCTDYDRELGIVAVIHQDSREQIVAVGQLVADADHRSAEFAVLVADSWQGNGLGSLVMDRCLEICQDWGIQQVTAEVDPRNQKMLKMFARRDFQRALGEEDDVLLSKSLTAMTVGKPGHDSSR